MLIQALCQYYDALARKGKILKDGYSEIGVSYLVALTPEGGIESIRDWREKKTIPGKGGKQREVLAPRRIILPKRSEKPGIDGNIIEHRPLYLFGLNQDGQIFTPEDKTNKARKSHEDFAKKNLAFLAEIDSPVVNAFRNFVLTWQPEHETQNPQLVNLGKDYAKSGYAFCLAGRPDLLLHEDLQLLKKWDGQYASAEVDSDVYGQCAILGSEQPIARIHGKIKGLPNPGTGGNVLVGFNSDAECSYGAVQSYNSNISQTAMQKYTAALNYLLHSAQNHHVIGDTAILHWAATDHELCNDLYTACMFDQNVMDAQDTQRYLNSVLAAAGRAEVSDELLAGAEQIDPQVDFYIVGMKTNSSRIAVEFCYRCRFGKLMENLAAHQRDIQIRPGGRRIPVWAIARELIPPKSKEKANDALMAKMMGSMINGYHYPSFLLATLVRRVKTDSDEENNAYIKMNDVRVGVIKGCINRALRLNGRKETITMALNLQNTDPAYLCGRLFAVLEGIQLKAANYSLNRTIRDAYFASACARPATVFPKIMKLTQYHLSKFDNPRYAQREIQSIIDGLESNFPATLSLAQQGTFIIGYYQQKNDQDEKIKQYQEEKSNDNSESL